MVLSRGMAWFRVQGSCVYAWFYFTLFRFCAIVITGVAWYGFRVTSIRYNNTYTAYRRIIINSAVIAVVKRAKSAFLSYRSNLLRYV